MFLFGLIVLTSIVSYISCISHAYITHGRTSHFLSLSSKWMLNLTDSRLNFINKWKGWVTYRSSYAMCHNDTRRWWILLMMLHTAHMCNFRCKNDKKLTETKTQSSRYAFRRKIENLQSFRVFNFALYPI